MTKQELRKLIKEKAAALPAEYKKEAGRRMAELVINSDLFKSSEGVFIYINMPDEPDTMAVIKEAFRLGKKVYVPRCREKPFMDIVEIKDLECLEAKRFGLMEPPESFPAAAANAPDLAVIPCVSAGKGGLRLGHGAGYYDSFLESFKGVKLCLCFEELLSDEIPMESHDVKMDFIVTENGFL